MDSSFKLPPALITDFYKKSLYNFSKLVELAGDYKKEILIINDENPTAEEIMIFLEKVLSACELSLNEVDIIQSGSDIISAQSKVVIYFGNNSANLKLPIVFPDFQVQPFNEKIYLTAPSLSIIKNDSELKKQLWQCLKRIFLPK